MASGNIQRRIAEAESQIAQGANGEWWQNHIVLGGTIGVLQYAENVKTGERVFDRAFVNQLFNPSGKGRGHHGHVDFDVRLGMPDDEYHSIMRDAFAAGAIDEDQMRSVLHISEGNG